MTSARRVVHYINILTDPGTHEHTVCSRIGVGRDDGVWFTARLEEQGIRNNFDVRVVKAADGEQLPTVQDGECVVLGGTFNGVHDGRPWQVLLSDWLKEYRQTGKPLLGICGGHQAMTVVLGGEVIKRANGTCAASLEVELTDEGKVHPLFKDVGSGATKDTPAFHFGNSDHVHRVPAGATILAATAAASDNSPAVAIDYGGRWYSTQFHPESAVEMWQQIISEKLIAGDEADYRKLDTGGKLIANFLAIAAEEPASAAAATPTERVASVEASMQTINMDFFGLKKRSFKVRARLLDLEEKTRLDMDKVAAAAADALAAQAAAKAATTPK